MRAGAPRIGVATTSDEAKRATRPELDRRGGWAIFLGLMAWQVVVQRGLVASYDGHIVYAVARAITHHRLSITRADDLFGMHTPYASYGIGVSLVVAPLYELQRLTGVVSPLLVTLANPVLVSVTGVVLHRCGLALGWPRRLAVAVGLGYGTLTMALQSGTDLFSEPGVALGTALVVLGVLRCRQRWGTGPLLIGTGLGLAVLFRSDSLLLVAPAVLLLPWLVPRSTLSGRRVGVALVGPVGVVLVWTAFYSILRSGTPLPQQYGGTFSFPLGEGLYGLLLSHGKSFFVYNPLLVLSLPGGVLLWRRDRAIAVLLVALAVVRPLLYARWSAWQGGVAWGPRFLLPCAVPLSLLTGEALRRILRLRPALPRRSALAVVTSLAAVSVVVSVASVWLGFEQSYNSTKATPGFHGQAAATARRANLDRYTYSLTHSAIGYNLSHLGTPHPALRHFSPDPDFLGLLAVLVGVAAPTAALVGHGSGRRVGPVGLWGGNLPAGEPTDGSLDQPGGHPDGPDGRQRR